MHHHLKESSERFGGLGHEVFHLVTELLIHSTLKFDRFNVLVIHRLDVSAIIGVFEQHLELIEVRSADEFLVLVFRDERLG